MTPAEPLKLNLGAGYTYIPGFVNVDISPIAEVTVELGREKLPFEDNSVDVIFSYQTLEHVENYLAAMADIYRVLKHGGRFLVGLPYVTLTEYHLVNPYHLHNFNEHSFAFFDPARLLGSAAEEHAIIFHEVYYRLHYRGAFNLMPGPIRKWCRRHLFNVVRKIDYGLLAVKDRSLPLNPPTPAEMVREFIQYMHSRVPYGQTKPAPIEKSWRNTKIELAKWWDGNGD